VFRLQIKKQIVVYTLLLIMLFLFFSISQNSYAQESMIPPESITTPKIPISQSPLLQINNYYSTQTVTYSNGFIFERASINGPPEPPLSSELDRLTEALPEPNKEMGINTLTVPAYNWVFGCSSVSGAMIAAYYDRNGFPNIYTGPTNGGVMPLDNSSWSTWTDGYNTYPNLPLAASHQGVDGRRTQGSIDDYWFKYGSTAKDPYLSNGWSQHTWGDAIGDYMKTSQSTYSNTDGATWFWNYSSASPLPCSAMETFSSGMGWGHISDFDGTYGRKLFYQARGYTVTDCYNQPTDNRYARGFSFAQYKSQIDAGQPVMLNLAGHTIVGVGYDDSNNTVFVHDTWDYNTHTMTWGSSYSGMQLQSVSIVNLQSPCTYSISPTIRSFSSNGGTGNVNVTAGKSCAWTAFTNNSWANITGGTSGSGNGVVTYTIAPNTGATRLGNLTIAGQTFSITQTNTIFSDISSAEWFYIYVQAIYNHAITSGCTQDPLNYCPDMNVTRGQMAAFIIRAQYGETFSYTTTPYYSDVPLNNTYFKYIQKLKDLGITTVSDIYGVNQEITRGQMAAFIIRAQYGETFSYTTIPYYSDVPPTNTFFKYVQKMRDVGITTATGIYMVDAIVTRAAIAASLSRAFLGMT
jgi:hypothetical protein